MRRLAMLIVCAAGLTRSPLRAEVVSYSIAVPAGTPAAFEIPLEAKYPGPVLLEASWTGARLLSFRVVPKHDDALVLHRSGPSPQRLELNVTSSQAETGPVRWTLEIRAPAGRDRADGTVVVTLPDPPDVVAAREAAENPPPPPPVPDPWTLAVQPQEAASSTLRSLFARVEELRAAIFGDDPFTIHDACGWQAEGLRWLSERRDALAANAGTLTPDTLRYFRRLARVIQAVEGLRTSKDPLFTRPVPAERMRQAWLMARRDALRPIELELDTLADTLRQRELPELSDARWLARLLACTTANERSFTQGGRGPIPGAESAESSDTQWSRIVAAAGAFDALAAWLDRDPSP